MNEQTALTLDTWEVSQVWSARYVYEMLQLSQFYELAHWRLTQLFGSSNHPFTCDERLQVIRIVQDASFPNDARLFAASLFVLWFHKKAALLEKEWTDLSNESINIFKQRYRLIFFTTISWYLSSNERAISLLLPSLYDKDMQIQLRCLSIFRSYLPGDFVDRALKGLLHCFDVLSTNNVSSDFMRETHIAFDLLRRQLSNETLSGLLEHDDEYLRDSAARMLIDRGDTGIRLADVRARRRGK